MNIDRKIWYSFEGRYIFREKDIFDYTILCLHKLGVNKFMLEDLYVSFKNVCDKYNNDKFVTDYVPEMNYKGELCNLDLVTYLEFYNKQRRNYYEMIKSKDFSRFETHRSKERAIEEMFECGFGIYNPKTHEVVSVFGKLFSSDRADYLIEHFDEGLEEIFDEVAQGIMQNKNLREESEVNAYK